MTRRAISARPYLAAMRKIIMNAGMLCDVAGNGKEALAAIENAAPAYHLVGRWKLNR